MRPAALLLAAFVTLSAPLAAAAEPPSAPLWGGALDEFDTVLNLPGPPDSPRRMALGDVHGFVHVYEQRHAGFEEIWTSDFLESSVAGLFLADVNLDDLVELVVYTEGGRFHYLDGSDYRTIWSNPPTDYQAITAMTLHNVDDDEQVEILFVGDGRLVIYDGRDQFEEWRSDQDNIAATDILVADVDGDGSEEIVLNDGFVYDARYRDLEWQSPESFGERMGLADVDDDEIPEIIGEFGGRYLRIFDVDLRRMKPARR